MTLLSSVILRDTLANRPTAGTAGRLFFDTTNSILYRDNGSSWDSVEGAGAGGAVATDTIWDAAGDLAVGTGADTASKLTKGSNYDGLVTDSSTATDLRWVPGTSILLYDYTVTGSDKASIDTGVDTPDAGIAGTSAFPALRTLEIFLYARTDEAVASSILTCRFNNDSGGVYDFTVTQTLNGTVVGGTTVGQTSVNQALVTIPGASAGSNAFGLVVATIPNYAGTVGNKMGSWSEHAADATAANSRTRWGTVQYRPASPAAITRFSVTPTTAAKLLKVGTRLIIYAR